MELTIYERLVALEYAYNEKPPIGSPTDITKFKVIATEVGAGDILETDEAIKNARISVGRLMFLAKQKTNTLKNISNHIEEMSDKNIEILNLAKETARKAFKLRQDLELSVLNSQLKMIEIEIMSLKTMTSEQFEAKYGVVR